MGGRRSIDVESLKQQAAGRWPDIIPALTSCPADILDGDHHPCPRCGGTMTRSALAMQEANVPLDIASLPLHQLAPILDSS